MLVFVLFPCLFGKKRDDAVDSVSGHKAEASGGKSLKEESARNQAKTKGQKGLKSAGTDSNEGHKMVDDDGKSDEKWRAARPLDDKNGGENEKVADAEGERPSYALLKFGGLCLVIGVGIYKAQLPKRISAWVAKALRNQHLAEESEPLLGVDEFFSSEH